MTGVAESAVLQFGCYSDPGSDLLKCSLGDLASSVGGGAIFALLGGTMLLATFWLASDGGLATPSVLTVLCGAVLITALPPAYKGMAMIVIFLGIAGAVLSGLSKYVSSSPYS